MLQDTIPPVSIEEQKETLALIKKNIFLLEGMKSLFETDRNIFIEKVKGFLEKNKLPVTIIYTLFPEFNLKE